MRSKHALNRVEATTPFTFSTPESAYSEGRPELTRCLPAASRTWHVLDGSRRAETFHARARKRPHWHVPVLGRQHHLFDGGDQGVTPSPATNFNNWVRCSLVYRLRIRVDCRSGRVSAMWGPSSGYRFSAFR